MRSLSDTLIRLGRLRQAPDPGFSPAGGTRLSTLPGFGSNPGALAARSYFPDNLPDHPALVVVLHGCTQTASGYDRGAGWSTLANRHGFALLFPEQQRANNANLCFNWFEPNDITRGAGEAFSIRQMIEQCITNHAIDRGRIYITGLSAGGAMTSVMLATYPEIFAGGAIIAGLPYGCAASAPQAFDRMRGHGIPGERVLQAAIRDASNHTGPWPTLSVWHGTADQIVSATNAESIIAQWRAPHGLGTQATRTEMVDGYPRRAWCDPTGRERIEAYSITGMGHGTPLNTMATGCGADGPYMLDAGISSTHHIARFWGLLPSVERAFPPPPPQRDASRRPAATDIRSVIDNALHWAGLLR